MSLNFGRRLRMQPMLQAEASECGLCCLAMIAAYYGRQTDLVSLRRTLGVSQHGASLQTIMQSAQQLGLLTRPLRLELDELSKLNVPAVLHWNLNHFVVLTRVRRNKVIIYDPAVGRRAYTLKQASQRFTGIALECVPGTEFAAGDERESLKLATFWRGAPGLSGVLVQLFVLSLMVQVFALASPFYVQIVVDDVLANDDQALLTVLALAFLGVALFSVATKAVRGLSALYLANQLSYNMGGSVLRHLLRLPLAYFEKRHVGDILSRFASTGPVQEFLSSGVVTVVIDGLLAITTLILMWIYSPLLTMVVLGSLLLYGLFRVAHYQPLQLATHESVVADANLETYFMETVQSIQSLKLADRVTLRQLGWQQKFADSLNCQARLGRMTLTHEAVNNTLTGCEHVLIVLLGAQTVLSNQMSIGMLYAFIAYRGHFNSAMLSIIQTVVQYRMLRLHLSRIADITRTETEQEISDDNTLMLPISGSLRAENLSFSYAAESGAVFHDVNLHIERGKLVAIYGPSGIGKTTLLKCLMGLEPGMQGSLFLDEIPVTTLGWQSIRRQTAGVLQNDVLFSGSIKDNVTFFDLQPDIERLTRVSQQALLHADVMGLPMGYETRVGAMGSALSAGQQQRVMIARCLYQQPHILFLDEGTAHIDSTTERQIMQTIRTLGITCIFITHNTDLFQLADKVVYWTKPGQPQISETEGVLNSA
ncbi:MAG: peptidase domain-containing ABC transporter [Pseudomonadota bacterium]